MAGRFSRRVQAYARRKQIPILKCRKGDRKHEIAHKYLPKDPNYKGVFLILYGKAQAPIWNAKSRNSMHPHLDKELSFVQHYYFHIMDPEWGHLTIRVCGHPPFQALVILNGHEWVERAARKAGIVFEKEGNCFVEFSDGAGLTQLADTLGAELSTGRLAQVCDRWIYSSCLCFGLCPQEQERSGFRYEYSVHQAEYSRTLLFHYGRDLVEVFQGLIDRSRRALDIKVLKTLFGRKRRLYLHPRGKKRPRMELSIETPEYDLTVLKIHFGVFSLKIYDKGGRALRAEATLHNAKALHTRYSLPYLPTILARLRDILNHFLNVLFCLDVQFLDSGMLDALATPSALGKRRLAGIDLNKPRMRNCMDAIIALSPKPEGFSVSEFTAKVREMTGSPPEKYSVRQGGYDLKKVRSKLILEPIPKTRRYTIVYDRLRAVAAILTIREKLLKPIAAGVCKPRRGRRPANPGTLDAHYEVLRRDLLTLLSQLGIAA